MDRKNDLYESLDKINRPNFFLWIDVAKQGDAPLRSKPLRGILERWLNQLDPDDVAVGQRWDDLPGYTHVDAG